MTKRVRSEDEEYEISDIVTEAKLITVNGVPAMISPIKKSKIGSKFFSGILKDENSQITFTAYNEQLYEEMDKAYNSGSPVKVANVNVQRNMKYGKNLHAYFNKNSTVKTCDKQMRLEKPNVSVSKIADIEWENQDMVCIQAKVLKVDDAMEGCSSTTFERISYKMADDTGCVELTMWNSHQIQLALGISYEIKNLKKTKYYGENVLHSTAYTHAKEVEAIIDSKDTAINVKGQIVGIKRTRNYLECCECGGEMAGDGEDATCGKCGAVIFKSICKKGFEAILLFQQEQADERKYLRLKGTALLVKLYPDLKTDSNLNDIKKAIMQTGKVEARIDGEDLVDFQRA